MLEILGFLWEIFGGVFTVIGVLVTLSLLIVFLYDFIKDLFKKRKSKNVEPSEVKIGEPVHAFINEVKSNPRRFKVWANSLHEDSMCSKYSVSIKDKENDLTFSVDIIDTRSYTVCDQGEFSVIKPHKDYVPCNKCSFLTKDELKYVTETLINFFNSQIKEKRKRISQKKRNKLINIYCNKEET